MFDESSDLQVYEDRQFVANGTRSKSPEVR
jgi:hypothetical protein